MAIEKLIPKEKVLGLKEIIGDDSEGIDEFNKIENYVKANLFSRFPQRKEYSIHCLSNFFNSPIDIYTITNSNTVYAYITLNNIESYLFIGKYENDSHLIEEMPDKEELEEWKQLNLN